MPTTVEAEPMRVTWKVSCGERRGDTLNTSVSEAEFSYETNANDPSAGRVEAVSFAEWQRIAPEQQWVVTSRDGVVISVASFAAPSDHDPCE